MKSDRPKTVEGFSRRLYLKVFQEFESTSAFARRIGVARSTVWRWFEGDSTPDCVVLVRVCTALRTTPNYLLYGKG